MILFGFLFLEKHLSWQKKDFLFNTLKPPVGPQARRGGQAVAARVQGAEPAPRGAVGTPGAQRAGAGLDTLHHPVAGEEWQNIALVKVIKGRFTTQSWLGDKI